MAILPPELRCPTPRHALRQYVTATFSPALAQRSLAFADQLPADRVEELGDLLDAAFEAGIETAVAVRAAAWERLLAQLGGLAPVLRRARADAEARVLDCLECRAPGP
jgi:hypothetical protein